VHNPLIIFRLSHPFGPVGIAALTAFLAIGAIADDDKRLAAFGIKFIMKIVSPAVFEVLDSFQISTGLGGVFDVSRQLNESNETFLFSWKSAGVQLELHDGSVNALEFCFGDVQMPFVNLVGIPH
jgi:hypothetical protein